MQRERIFFLGKGWGGGGGWMGACSFVYQVQFTNAGLEINEILRRALGILMLGAR